MKRLCWVAATLLACCALALAAGCRKADDGMSQEQLQKADRLTAIARQSGGDWSKVSQSDREYVMKMVPSGSEQGARMLLLSKSGRLNAAPGGPRPGGPGQGGPRPGGPPGR